MAEQPEGFVHLHNHSEYSLLDGIAKVDDIVARMGELNFDTYALTDHGVMYGSMEFYTKLTKAGPTNQSEVVDSLKKIHGERVVKRVLKNQAGKLWTVNKGAHNADLYSHVPGVTLPPVIAKK